MADNFDDAETLILGEYVPEGPELAAPAVPAGEDGLLDLLEDPAKESTETIPGVISGESGDSGYAPSTAISEAPEMAPKLAAPEATEVAPEMCVDAAPEKGVKRAATLTLDMGEDLEMDTGGEMGDDEKTAVLWSTNPSTAKDIWLGAACTSVGRDDTNTIILDDPRVSAEQFRVHRKVNPDGLAEYELEDCSRNGTLLNKKLLHKDGNQRACLQDQDLLEVLPASKVGKAAAITFLFHTPSVAAPSKKRRLTEGGDEGSKSELGEGVFKEATCAICQEVMHRATSVQPCMHSFCSSCLGGWLKRPGAMPRCPICRQAVAAVGKNHALDGLIDGLLKAHPEKQRTLAALADLDDRDPLHDNGYDLVKLRGRGDTAAGFARLTVAAAAAAEAMDADEGSVYSESHGPESEEEDAEPAHAWTEPGAVRPPCAKCGVPAWRPLSSAAEAVCHPMAATALTKTALGRNTFEEEILQEWLGAKGLSLLQAILHVLAAPNPEGVPAVRWHSPGAPPEFLGSPGAWTNLPSCNSCCQMILRGVVYSIRERIAAEELPERARGRGNCWYGRCCRTQSHKRNHAERLNHICEQTRHH